MEKVEYPKKVIEDVVGFLNGITITGIDNAKKLSLAVQLLDSGTIKKSENTKQEDNNGKSEQRKPHAAGRR